MGTCASSNTLVEHLDSGGNALRGVLKLYLVVDTLTVLLHIVAPESAFVVHGDDDVAVDVQVGPEVRLLAHAALHSSHFDSTMIPSSFCVYPLLA